MRYSHFSKTERLELSILLKKGYSRRAIAEVLDRSPASVSREIQRNSVAGRYDPIKAQHKSYVKRKHSKYQGMKIRCDFQLEDYVVSKLKQHWSPEQIAGRLKLKHNDQTVISSRVIYKYIRSPFGQWYNLARFLKYQGNPKRRKSLVRCARRTAFDSRVFIDQRPEAINQRLRYGDFEGDTLGVPKHSSETLAVLLERKSRYFLARKISRPKYAVAAFSDLLKDIPAQSLTLDNGVENARYQELGLNSYFCHPYASWEKGSLENMLGVVREYIPKKKPLNLYSDEDIAVMVEEINTTPRKCLNWQTPHELFHNEYLNRCCT